MAGGGNSPGFFTGDSQMMWAFGLFVSGVVCAVLAVTGFNGSS